MKKENRKLARNLPEVTGDRTELKPYLGEELNVSCFVTNTTKYQGQKRLVTEIKIHGMFIKHAWMKTSNIGKLEHGYQKLKVKVVKYVDQVTHGAKYGLKYIGKEGKVYQNDKMVKPKWMK